VDNAGLEKGLLCVFLIDVGRIQITCQSGVKIDVRLGNRFGEFRPLTDPEFLQEATSRGYWADMGRQQGFDKDPEFRNEREEMAPRFDAPNVRGGDGLPSCGGGWRMSRGLGVRPPYHTILKRSQPKRCR
jgi:hypothetical protein